MEISAPELFLKYHYAEGKDLLKAFLTLQSATLVLSITFAEKIVEFKASSGRAKNYLMTCWISLVVSIVLSGLSICAIALAGGVSLADLYAKRTVISERVFDLAGCATVFGFLGGAVFVLALVLMILAAKQSMWKDDLS
ncbi:hypothetical protein [Bradyrhizobium sp. 1]|uniref:hypothetical protein n=1 Tax=Bradyrhizobium sp. 1 TaxID=241591 RepID=UPI001FF741A6|nr:hypothetical protein [Bradyrhizobium sp. 1]MCK1395266.1 hypothetical protein [Bradyrhizobium sp. 1]